MPDERQQSVSNGSATPLHHGFYNETSVAIITFGMFSTVGYWLGKWFGRLGDQETEPTGMLRKDIATISEQMGKAQNATNPERIKSLAEQMKRLSHRATYGKGEAAWKWVFGLVLGGTSVAVALKNLREAQYQSGQLAKRAEEMERTREALSGQYSPLPDRATEYARLEEVEKTSPDARVRQAETAGMLQAQSQEIGKAGSAIVPL